MRLWIILLISMLFIYHLNDGTCRGSKCKRKKNNAGKDGDHGSNALSQIDDIESKKQEKTKSEEESEEKDKKEKDKLGQEQVQRHRRAESELKREPEQSDEERYMVIGIQPRTHSQFAFRHRKRQAPTHDHNHNKEGEPVGDIKDANVWTEKSAIVSRKRRAMTHRQPEADSEEAALDNLAKLFFAHIGSIKTGEAHRSKYDDTKDTFENMISLSRQPRHVTGEEHTHSGEENEKTPKLMSRKRRAYDEPKDREGIRRGEESDINRWNLERRRYPTGGIGPSGHERVLPLPVSHPEYPRRTNEHVPPYKPKYPDPNNDF
ncbi:hypothetical protein Ddc_01092 [Ditylenchus destructor]|nr:hypothetical protein Ddc_01092 [Ditylenchus destructor]